MRFVLVIDDNDMPTDPRQVIANVLEVAREHVLDGDRSRPLFVPRDSEFARDGARIIGGFELTLGPTEGREGWRKTR